MSENKQSSKISIIVDSGTEDNYDKVRTSQVAHFNSKEDYAKGTQQSLQKMHHHQANTHAENDQYIIENHHQYFHEYGPHHAQQEHQEHVLYQEYDFERDNGDNHNKQKFNYGVHQPPDWYPKEIPPEVQEELKQQEEARKKKKKGLCLNCVPGLNGKIAKQQFIIKVYGILLFQIAITISVILITLKVEKVKNFMKSHQFIFWIAFGLSFGIMFFLFGCNILVRKVPWNYIILTIFTITSSYMVASICIWQDPQNILIAAAVTFGMFLGLTLLAFFTTYDITLLSGMISSLSLALLIMLILIWIMPYKYIMCLVCGGIIVILSLFIIYDTQVIANQSKYKLSYDDYIIGSILLYTDIVTIFLFLLLLLGAIGSRKN